MTGYEINISTSPSDTEYSVQCAIDSSWVDQQAYSCIQVQPRLSLLTLRRPLISKISMTLTIVLGTCRQKKDRYTTFTQLFSIQLILLGHQWKVNTAFLNAGSQVVFMAQSHLPLCTKCPSSSSCGVCSSEATERPVGLRHTTYKDIHQITVNTCR